ncbi:MAG: ABC transporter permease [Chloroflexota bacterium]
MTKLFLIGLKDLKLAFRDRAALILMLLAPFLLTLGLGFVTGRFSGGSGGIGDIPVVIVNLDKDQLGDALVDLFNSDDLSGLVTVTEADDPEAARRSIDEDQAAAAVIVPAGFTQSVIPSAEQFTGTSVEAGPLQIEVYANPSRPTGAGIVKSIVDEFASRVEEGRLTSMTAITQLLMSGRLAPQDAGSAGQAMGERLAESPEAGLGIALSTNTASGETNDFDVLAYMAPGMALMFLMFTTSYGGRSLLAERSQGTLPRLLVSPTSTTQVMGGKVLGIFFTGAAQLFILIGASTLFFQLKWGDPLGVIALVLAAVFAATGWGMLITAIARTPAQVSNLGSAVMLIFGIMGGSFIQLEALPEAVQWFSKITPNAWGLDGFTTLALGNSLAQLGRPLLALTAMGAVLFTVAVIVFNRKGITQK